MSICPICGEEVKPRAANKAFPFCTARCKSIDLGKWLSEEYRVPAGPPGETDLDEGNDNDDGGREPDMRH
ncbi:MAG: DNA gyrase inhibitor YacG [Labilithrix sp.]|nr:DNA gyrase inhibitor YacG [Labilithrix sp.]